MTFFNIASSNNEKLLNHLIERGSFREIYDVINGSGDNVTTTLNNLNFGLERCARVLDTILHIAAIKNVQN